MKFYSLHDLIEYRACQKGENIELAYQYLSKKGIKKSDLVFLRDNCSLESVKNFLPAIQEYLGMTELEIFLSLGIVPERYKTTFFENIHEISCLLEKQSPLPYLQNNEIEPCFTTQKGKLFNMDCIQLLSTLPDNSIDLIFADPPFNLSKQYDKGIVDNLNMSEYLTWSFQWINECIRVLKPGGAFFVYNIPKWSIYYAEYLNKFLTLRSWIAIDMKFSLPINGRLNPNHYSLLYYIKGQKPNTFNNQRIPIQTCRHCGGEIKDYGGYKNKMNSQGVNLNDVWTDIYPVRHKSTKNRPYNELSVKMLDRIISMASNKGDMVFDPFGGSGTTFIVAELLERQWCGAELGDCEIISDRFLQIEKDKRILKKVCSEKNIMFTQEVQALRKKNDFWLCEDFKAITPAPANHQYSLTDILEDHN